MPRRRYSGNAKKTTLASSITSTATSIAVVDGTGWPNGAGDNFWMVVDRGLSTEEKILCSTRTTNTITAVDRTVAANRDDTTNQSHSAGAEVEHVWTKTDADEVNDHTFDTTNDDHTQYLNNARHDVTARHAFGAALGTPVTPIGPTDAGTVGTGTIPARQDHRHPATRDYGFYRQVTDMGISGQFHLAGFTSQHGAVVTTIGGATNTIYYAPLVSSRGGTLDLLGVWLQTNFAGGATARMALYTAVSTIDLRPSGLVAGSDTGTVAIDAGAGSMKTFTVNLALTPNQLYWVAFQKSTVTSGQLGGFSTSFPAGGSNMFGWRNDFIQYSSFLISTLAYAAFAGSPTSSPNDSTMPALFIRYSA